jgi:hypothetical protein
MPRLRALECLLAVADLRPVTSTAQPSGRAPAGGSQVHATATHAIPAVDGTWRVSGTKTWDSRLTEAAAVHDQTTVLLTDRR